LVDFDSVCRFLLVVLVITTDSGKKNAITSWVLKGRCRGEFYDSESKLC